MVRALKERQTFLSASARRDYPVLTVPDVARPATFLLRLRRKHRNFQTASQVFNSSFIIAAFIICLLFSIDLPRVPCQTPPTTPRASFKLLI
jgi:hypothetical protein